MASLKYLGLSTQCTLLPSTSSIGDKGRSDKWEIAGTYKDDKYPVCTYTLPDHQGKLEGTLKLYVIGKKLKSQFSIVSTVKIR